MFKRLVERWKETELDRKADQKKGFWIAMLIVCIVSIVMGAIICGCGFGPHVTVRPGASWQPMSQAMADRLMEQANAPGGAEWITDEELNENEEE